MKQAVASLLVTAALLAGTACTPATSVSENHDSDVQIPANTRVDVRLEKDLDSSKLKAGDSFAGKLDQPIVANGKTIVPAGATVEGQVTNSEVAQQAGSAGKLGLALKSLHMDARTYDLASDPYDFANTPIKQSDSQMAKDPTSPTAIRKGVENALLPKDTVIAFTLKNAVSIRPKI